MLNPITGSTDEGLEGIVSCSSALTGALSVRKSFAAAVLCSSVVAADLDSSFGLRGTTAGRSTLSATLTARLSLAGGAAGSSSVSGSLRIDDEANVFLEGAIFCSTEIEATFGVGQKLAGLSHGAASVAGTLSISRGESFGFTIYVDILDSTLASAANMQRLSARFTVDGVAIPIQEYSIEGPEDALGVSLSVSLARLSDRALITSEAEIGFETGVWAGSAYTWIPRLQGGRALSTRHDLGFSQERPTDVFQFGAGDALADRWTRRPAQALTYYDPQKMDKPLPPGNQQLVHTEGGVPLEPVSVAIAGLTLHQVLDLAYRDGCDFDEVITNIPDFPVTEVSFTLSGGYHAGASALIQLFEPDYFPDGNTLWIMYAGAQVPFGVTARPLPLSALVTVSDERPARQPVDAIILEYAASGGDFFTERTQTDPPVESGSFESKGYTRQNVTRRIREYRNTSAPDVVVREEQTELVIETYANLETIQRGAFELGLLARETVTAHFDSLNRKSGHARTIEARLPDINQVELATIRYIRKDGSQFDKVEEVPIPRLLTVEEERYSIFYRQSGSAGVDEMAQTITQQDKLVLFDDTLPYLKKPYEIPYTDAHQSGAIDSDHEQWTQFKPVRTVIETFVREGASVEVRRQVTNHLNVVTIEHTTAQTRAGSIAVSRRAQGIVKKLLTVDGATQGARLIPTYNAGELPQELALELGKRKLNNLNKPPRVLRASVYGLLLDVRRGTIVEAYDRDGRLGSYRIKAFSEQGRRQGNGFEIAERLTGKELK